MTPLRTTRSPNASARAPRARSNSASWSAPRTMSDSVSCERFTVAGDYCLRRARLDHDQAARAHRLAAQAEAGAGEQLVVLLDCPLPSPWHDEHVQVAELGGGGLVGRSEL